MNANRRDRNTASSASRLVDRENEELGEPIEKGPEQSVERDQESQRIASHNAAEHDQSGAVGGLIGGIRVILRHLA
jgi:hypothetical protein